MMATPQVMKLESLLTPPMPGIVWSSEAKSLTIDVIIIIIVIMCVCTAVVVEFYCRHCKPMKKNVLTDAGLDQVVPLTELNKTSDTIVHDKVLSPKEAVTVILANQQKN